MFLTHWYYLVHTKGLYLLFYSTNSIVNQMVLPFDTYPHSYLQHQRTNTTLTTLLLLYFLFCCHIFPKLMFPKLYSQEHLHGSFLGP